jgi:two-component system, chemotaxis family, sensor kinase Cph1
VDRENHVIKRDNTKGNEEFCGKVPLHQTNLIQPHGVLLVVKTDDFSILQCSENVSRFLGQDAAKVVTTNLADYFLSEELAILKKRLSLPLSGKIPVTLHVQQVSFLALLQQYEGYFILEVEKIEMEDGQHSFVEIYQELKLVTTAIEEADTLQEATAVAARELKRISGFDKVMIYQFDPDWNGEVIAEEMEEGMDTYLGLKFPASDIPKQARDLYKRCPYRLIPTVDYTPVRLYPVINPLTQTFTNLTDSNFRSVAAVHLEYLKNMKVAASMSTRILVEGELWGLIACHHRQPNYLLPVVFGI